jgi:hypothetical protein
MEEEFCALHPPNRMTHITLTISPLVMKFKSILKNECGKNTIFSRRTYKGFVDKKNTTVYQKIFAGCKIIHTFDM